MTLADLRSSFTQANDLIAKTRELRENRLQAIDALPVKSPWMILHIVPFLSANQSVTLDLARRPEFEWMSPHKMEGGYLQSAPLRYNLDGPMMRVMGHGADWHTQLFRNGALEHINNFHFDEHRIVHAWDLQITLVNALPRMLRLLGLLGCPAPATVMVTLRGVLNHKLRTGAGHAFFAPVFSDDQIEQDTICLPEIVIQDYTESPTQALRPVFDALWNSAGLERCGFYDTAGNWNIDPSWLDQPRRS